MGESVTGEAVVGELDGSGVGLVVGEFVGPIEGLVVG